MMTRIFCAVLVAATGVFAQANAKLDLAALSTALCDAIAKGDVAAAQKAVDSGAKVDLACPVQQTLPLHYAVIQGNIALVKLLLDKGANVKQEDGDSMYSPLHYAAALEDPAIATLLIERGADVNASSEDASTPLDVALMQKREATAKVIQKWGGKQGEEDVVQLQPETTTEDAPSQAQSTAESTPPPTSTPSRSPDGRLMFKGLYVGMSLEEAGEVMAKLGLPPEFYGKTDDKGNKKFIRPETDGTFYTYMPLGGVSAWQILADKEKRVTRIYIRGAAVDQLFNCKGLAAFDFAKGFVEAYGLPGMDKTLIESPDALAQIYGGSYLNAWQYSDPQNGYEIWIDEQKDIMYKATKRMDEVKF